MIKLEKVVISPPFGNYLKCRGCTSVLGSFTVNRRIGAIFQFIRTFRKYEGGYINKIGLRNKGFSNLDVKKDYGDKIVSLATLKYEDWDCLATYANAYLNNHAFKPLCLELNLSCPNVDTPKADIHIFNKFSNFNCILKLPPTDLALEYVKQGLSCGIKYFHFCNTIASKNGGISGALLKEKSLYYIQKARQSFGDDIKIIGGGGIYCIEDVKAYQQAGADHFSLSTAVINNPLRLKRIINYCNNI